MHPKPLAALSLAATLAFSVGLAVVDAPLAYASDSTADIVQAMANRSAVTYGAADWRDFGTSRTFNRVVLTTAAATSATLEYFDFEAMAWQRLYPDTGGIALNAGSNTVTFDDPLVASKIRVLPSSVTLAGVYNDSPIATTTGIEITTTVGVPPSLPAHLNVDQENGGRLLLSVTWPAPTSAVLTRYETPGVYTVTGSYADGGITGTATATITVTAEKGIIELDTPYMGWNHWYALYMNPTDTTFKAQVEEMERNGLLDAGYDIVWIDEGWWGNSDNKNYRDSDGNMIASQQRFHGNAGIKELADWVHAKGLKFGIYTDTGVGSCGGYYGSGGDNWFENYRKDVAFFKSVGADAVKLDHCGAHNDAGPYMDTNFEVYAAFYQAMRAEGATDMILDTCEWGQEAPGDWAYKIANAWRTDGDLGTPALGDSFFEIWERNVNRAASGPGAKGWNDPDYLTIDAPNNKMTPSQFRTYFTLWAISASPLILSQDVRVLKPENLETLKNADMIAIDQDPLGIQASEIRRDQDKLQVWSKPLVDKDGKARAAVTLLNRSDTVAQIGFNWTEAGLANVTKVRNVWDGTDESGAASYSGWVFPGEVITVIGEGDAVAPTSGYAQVNYAPQSLIYAPSGSNQYQRSQAAADYRTDTYWRPNFNDLDGSQWILADFEGVTRSIGKVVMNMQDAFTTASQIDYWDGSAWQAVPGAAKASLAVGVNTYDFSTTPVSTTKVRWRAVAGGSPQVREFEVYGPDPANSGYTNMIQTVALANPNQVQNGDASCFSSSDYAGYGCDKIMDGIKQNGSTASAANATGRWNSGNPGNGEYVGVSWTTPVTGATTLSIFYGSWWNREIESVVEYRESSAGPWIELGTVAKTPTPGQIQATDTVDFDMTGKTVQAVQVRFTNVIVDLDTSVVWKGYDYPTLWEIELNTPVVAIPLVAKVAQAETKAGRAPELPAKVDVRYSDGAYQRMDVTWDPIPPADYADAGFFAVNGTVDSISLSAKALVTVLARPESLAELQALYDANKDLDPADYAAGAWPAFSSALDEAKQVLDDAESATAAEIATAAIALEDAVDALAYIKDLKELALGSENLQAGDFLPTGWSAFTSALSDAQVVLANPNCTARQASDAYADLKEAVDALKVANLALPANGGTATASSRYNASYDADALNDGSYDTRWNSAASPEVGEWAQLAWATGQVVNEVRLVFNTWAARAKLVDLQYEVDGEWVTLATIATDPVGDQIEAAEITKIPLGNIEVTKLRVIWREMFTYNGGVDPTFWEFEVYNWPVTQADPVSVDIVTDQAPQLPENVPTRLSTGVWTQSPVDWDPIPASAYASPGTLTVTGTIAGTSVPAAATVTVVQRGDTGPLVDLVAGAQSLLDSGKLTAAAVSALAGPVADAEALLARGVNVSQSDVDVVFDALLAAVGQAELDSSKIGRAVDVELLATLVSLAEAVPTERFTDVSVAVLLEKLEAARAVLADAGRSQADVEAAIAGVQDAVAGLRNHYVTQLVTNVTALNLVKKKTFQ
ncbi:MAG: Ig-like domain-containing protein, partial [Propionibacteriaceae bacterium]|nr:Ig-like domain-containing protein [Propionibacteriaceae bacterium]